MTGTTTIRNAMTVDVEDYFHVAALSEVIRKTDWDQLESRVEGSTRRLLNMYAESGIHATFFVLGWVARRSPGLIREIHAAGHEVACHGMTHDLIYSQAPEVFAQETREAKAVLEDLISAPVLGYRAASWSITRKSLWALDVLQDAGFAYDSSVFPIRHDRYGVPGASRWPGLLTTPAGRQIIEFPPSTDEIAGFRLPVAGGGYFRLLPYWLIRGGLSRINRRDHMPFNFYLHPWEVDPGQPRLKPKLLSRIRHYTNLSKTEGRLRDLIREFRFTTACNVLADLGLLTPVRPSGTALPIC